MNPETPQAMNPRTEPPMAEPPRTAVPAPEPSPGKPEKRSGLLRKYLDVWADRDLDMDDRDTSGWNIYYYYYRHIYQKRATVKLSYLRWIALLFHVLYFGSQILGLAVVIITSLRKGKTDPADILLPLLTMGSTFGLQWFILLFPFLPVIMVSPAFKLRAKRQGLMTSRAKEPPLLAHLVQYTTDKGLVAGALQSLLFTWRKFGLLLLPCIIETAVLLTGFAVFFADSPLQIVVSLGIPLGVVMIILTVSVCALMLSFCFRWDSLLVMVLIGILAVVIVFDRGSSIAPIIALTAGVATRLEYASLDFVDFWVLLLCCFIPACLLGSLYFVLAAADTNEYGLGRTSKRVRTLLFSMSGVFLALILSVNLAFNNTDALGPYDRLLGQILAIFVWGLYACVCCLLVTSISFTSHKAALLRMKQPGGPFRKKLLDPASPVSLFPVLVLEGISIIAVKYVTGPLQQAMYLGTTYTISTWSMFAVVSWTVLHIALGCAFWRQKPEIREPWNTHATFNSLTVFSAVIILLILALFDEAAVSIATILYILTVVIGIFFILGSAMNQAKSAAPAGDVPAQGQDKEAL